MEDINPLRITTSELIGFGTIGSILEPALDVLKEVEPRLVPPLQYVLDEVMNRFHEAEARLFEIEELK